MACLTLILGGIARMVVHLATQRLHVVEVVDLAVLEVSGHAAVYIVSSVSIDWCLLEEALGHEEQTGSSVDIEDTEVLSGCRIAEQ